MPLQHRQGITHRLQLWLLWERRFRDLKVVRNEPSSGSWRRGLLNPAQLLLDYSVIGRGAPSCAPLPR